MTLYKIKNVCHLLRSCLVGAWRMLFFVAEQVSANGVVWSLHNAGTQCTVQGERRPKGRADVLHFLVLQ